MAKSLYNFTVVLEVNHQRRNFRTYWCSLCSWPYIMWSIRAHQDIKSTSVLTKCPCLPPGFLPDRLCGVHAESGEARVWKQQAVLPEPLCTLHLPVLQGQPHAGYALRRCSVRQWDGKPDFHSTFFRCSSYCLHVLVQRFVSTRCWCLAHIFV